MKPNDQIVPQERRGHRRYLGSTTAVDGDIETETCLEFSEGKGFDKGFLDQQHLESVIDVENLDSDNQLLPSGDDVESPNEKLLLDNESEERVDVIDLYTSNLANSVETKLNAAIMGTGNLVTVLAGENLARAIAEDLFNVRDSLAVLAIGDIISERRSNSAATTYRHIVSIIIRTLRAQILTAFEVAFDINTVVTFSAVGNTAYRLAGRATRIIMPLGLGKTLRATSMREVPAHPIALAVGWLADAVSRVLAGRSSVAVVASKVTRTANATERTGVGRVATLLLAVLVVDL